MFSSFRNRFGIPGVISVIALVFAMFGGAYAASNDGGSGKATASAKAKKGPRGPRGKTGPAGPAGPAGPQGPAGAKGADGAPGLDGEKGATGATGATGLKGATGPTGPTGTTGVTGTTGPTGDEGSPWTAGGTLPPGETETGAWGVGSVPKVTVSCEPSCTANATAGPELVTDPLISPISFPIPLADELDGDNVHFIKTNGKEIQGFGEGDSTVCLGTKRDPQALPGHLCVYATEVVGILNFVINRAGGAPSSEFPGASKTGALVYGQFGWSTGSYAFGTWAVTAPTE